MFTWVYAFIYPRRWMILLLLGLGLITTALTLLQPWLIKLLIDDGLIAKDYEALWFLCMAMFCLSIGSLLLSGINRYLHTHLSGKILFALREDVYQHLQTLSPYFYTRHRTGDILSRLDGDIAAIQRFAVDSLFAAFSSILGLVGAITLMLLLSWQLALVLCLLIPLEIIWLRWMRLKVEQRVRTMRQRSADLSSFLVETLPIMKFIQSLTQEAREAKRLQTLNHSYLDSLLKLQITEFITQAIPNTLTSLSRVVIFLIGGYWVIQGQWQLGALIAFSTYLGMALAPIQSLLGLYVAVQRVKVHMQRVMELRLEPALIQQYPQTQSLAKRPHDLSFKDVSFQHDKQTEPLFSKVNFTIPAGSKVLFSGESGAGKSSFIDLLQRHYDPTSGQIFLGDIELRDCKLKELRQQVAIVSQDIVIFRGTLADNIRYAVPQASHEQVLHAAQQAQLSSLIEQLPQGLDHLLGEKGNNLSGGQKQRIAIARTILQQPSLLILDEATTGLDRATEAEILQMIDQHFAKQTRIMISHHTQIQADYYLHLAHQKITITQETKP